MRYDKQRHSLFGLVVLLMVFLFCYGLSSRGSLYAESQYSQKDFSLNSKKMKTSKSNYNSDDSDLYNAKKNDEGSFLSLSVGLGLDWMLKKEYGYEYQKKVVPELSIYTYLRIKDPFYIRNSMYFGYSWMQPQMPQSLKVTEKEFLLLTDISFLYNWFVVPSLSAGVGYFYRMVSLGIAEPVHMDEDVISDNEWIFTWYLQFGVGLPIFKDVVLLEPFTRLLFLKDDKRTTFAFGFNFSYYLVK